MNYIVEYTPCLSVIMGAFNIGHLTIFDQAMRSILDQTMRNFEFIICDDGSTDNTWEKLTELARLDDRVRLLRNNQNEGLAATLNRCLAVARGQFIARQDADDLSVPDRVQQELDFLRVNPEIAFVGSNVVLWDQYGDWGRRVFPEYPGPKDFLFSMPYVHGALMFRRNTLDIAGGYRVAKETRRAEDYDLLMRIYANGLRGANLQTELYRFCEDEAAMGRRKYRYRVDDVIIRWKGFSALGLLPGAFPYVLKPLVVGLIPRKLLRRLKARRIYKM